MSTLPPGWSLAPFYEVISIDSDLVDPGLSPDAAHIAPNHIESGTGRLLPFTTVAEDGVTSAKHRFHPGQILYSKIRPYLAKAVLVDFEGLCSADMYPMSTALEPRFVHRWLLSDTFTQRVSQDQGRTVLPKVNQAALNKVMVPVPPIAEQRRIADKIERSLARSRRAKEALDAVPPLLDKLRQSILAAAFRGDLTADWRAKNPNVEPADQLLARIRIERNMTMAEATLVSASVASGELPPGWIWTTLGEICVIASGQTPKGIEAVLSNSGAVPWFRVADMNLPANQVEMAEISQALGTSDAKKLGLHVRPVGTIVFPKRGGAIATNKKRRLSVPSAYDLNIMGLVPAKGLGDYLFRWMGTVDLARLNNGSTIPQINNGDVVPLRIPLPPSAEQAEIVRIVDRCISALNTVASTAARQIESLTELDQSILAKAFRGELVPQDPTDEPASALLDRIRSTREATPPPKPRRARKASAEAPAPAPAPPPVELTASTLAAEVFPALWPRGPLDKGTAVRTLAEHLRSKGAIEFKRLRADGPLYAQLLAAIESAVKSGELDRPRRAHVRAIKLDATAYTPDDWRQVLLASLGPEPIHQEDAIRHAAEWARDNLGLEFTRLRADGHIATGLRSAITSAIRQRLIERDGPKRIVLPRG